MHDKIKQFSYINAGNLPLIRGVGFGQGDEFYNWDASKRHDQLVVLQVTLSGTGSFSKGKYVTKLDQQSAFLAKIPGNFTYYGDEWRFLYIEFSETMVQWLVEPIQICQLSDKFILELERVVAELLVSELSVLENAQQAFSLFIKIIDELNPMTLKENSEINNIKNYFDTYYYLDLSLTSVADRFEMSKYQLIRQFENEVGTTPMNYLTKIRINQALNLLWSTTDTIELIAKTVGFSSSNYFSKVFKKEVGKTPTAYRQQGLFYYDGKEELMSSDLITSQ